MATVPSFLIAIITARVRFYGTRATLDLFKTNVSRTHKTIPEALFPAAGALAH